MVQYIRQWYYRGSLDSCNYSCNYCPFSKKHKCSREELAEDEKSLAGFVDNVIKKAEESKQEENEQSQSSIETEKEEKKENVEEEKNEEKNS